MPDVYVMQGGDVAQMAYDAISRVFTEEAAGLRILLKVNTGFKGPAASGLCTHPEVVRGLIRFFKERQVGQLLVGDSSIVGSTVWRRCVPPGSIRSVRKRASLVWTWTRAAWRSGRSPAASWCSG